MSGVGAEALAGLGDPALELDGVAGVEVLLTRGTSALTRFADSRVHQSTQRTDGTARVRVLLDDDAGLRVGVVSTGSLEAAVVRAAAEQAREVARVTPPDPSALRLQDPGGAVPAVAHDEATAHAGPDARAAVVRMLLSRLGGDVLAAGSVSTGVEESAVVSTTGLRVSSSSTRAALTVLAFAGQGRRGDPTGWAEDAGPSLAGLDADSAGRRAAAKVEAGRVRREVGPGTFEVVLEPVAVAEAVQWLGVLAFSGKAYVEGRSALVDRLGEQVCSDAVTLVDDATAAGLPGEAFDGEGTPTRRVPLVEAGVARAVVHDRATAAQAGDGATTTGHALPQPNTFGPLPRHLLLEPGTATDDELVAGVERGLLVTRFHYTNVIHPLEASITGMTRDGTFLVEDGRVVGSVGDLRFGQPLLEALGDVRGVGARTAVGSSLFFGPARVPSLHLGGWRVTSVPRD